MQRQALPFRKCNVALSSHDSLVSKTTMPECILSDLESLRESFAKEARIYTKQGQVPDGARPHQITPWQLACGYMAGTYRVAAHEVGKVIKKHKQKL